MRGCAEPPPSLGARAGREAAGGCGRGNAETVCGRVLPLRLRVCDPRRAPLAAPLCVRVGWGGAVRVWRGGRRGPRCGRQFASRERGCVFLGSREPTERLERAHKRAAAPRASTPASNRWPPRRPPPSHSAASLGAVALGRAVSPHKSSTPSGEGAYPPAPLRRRWPPAGRSIASGRCSFVQGGHRPAGRPLPCHLFAGRGRRSLGGAAVPRAAPRARYARPPPADATPAGEAVARSARSAPRRAAGPAASAVLRARAAGERRRRAPSPRQPG